MKNKNTGVVFPYNEDHTKDTNCDFLVECMADGSPMGTKPASEPAAPAALVTPPVETLVVADPPAPLPPAPRVIKMPDAPLEKIPLTELQDLADDMGVENVNGMKKDELIKAIRVKQSEAAEKAAEKDE